jgi:hypothetical protein
MCTAARAIIEKKNQDYGGGLDAYANFRGASFFGVSPVTGIILRVSDKLMRLKTYQDTGALLVKDESVTDSLLDIINYMIIIHGYILDAKEQLELKEAKKESERESIVAMVTNGNVPHTTTKEEAYQMLRDAMSETDRIQMRVNAFGWTLVDSELKGKPIRILNMPDDSEYFGKTYKYNTVGDITYPSCT